MIPITGLDWFIMSLVYLITGFRIRRAYFKAEKKKSKLALKAFMGFFLFMGTFLFLMALPHIALLQTDTAHLFPTIMAYTSALVRIFLYLAFAHILSVSLLLYFPRIQKPAFYLMVFGGVVAVLINIVFLDKPVFDIETGITINNSFKVIGIINPILATLGFFPTALIFLIKGLKSLKRVIKIRSLIIASGLIVSAAGGPVHTYADTVFLAVVAGVTSLIGVLLIAWGVFYKGEVGEEEEEEDNTQGESLTRSRLTQLRVENKT